MKIAGVWLPIITPFSGGSIDYKSYKKLIDYYTDKGINGLIPLGTTGESPTLTDIEFEEMIEKTLEYNKKHLPVFIGVGGNCTAKVVKQVKVAEKYKIDGILSVCPYYNRPDQNGIYSHFKSISEETSLNIIVYNIPYRTGRNIENETIYRLAEHKNIVGLKDSCGDIKQTMALLNNPPKDFSILTGEDILFYSTLTLGGQGGILAASHIKTEMFVSIYNKIKENDHESALKIWNQIYNFIPLLFAEPNPAPLKYCLQKEGLIESSEVRLPLTQISDKLKARLDSILFE